MRLGDSFEFIQYHTSGNIREILIFANFARKTKSRV